MVLDWFRRKPRRVEQAVPFDQLDRLRNLSNLSLPTDTSPVASDGPTRAMSARAKIEAARRQIIVFREFFPPPFEPGLSFYGGTPVGPSGMTWPRGDADGRPLTFMMQWDSAALAANDATGLLPRDGALYLFSSLEWGERMLFRFVHAEADGQNWAPLPLPDDLPPVFRSEAARNSRLVSPHVPADRQDPPRLLPHWPFVPIAVDLPTSMPTDDNDPRFWADGPEVKEAILRAQDPLATPMPEPVRKRPVFERPFPEFPHDWAAVRVIAAAALDKLMPTPRVRWQRSMPDADDATREKLNATWRAEALALYDEAVAQGPGAAVPSDRVDALWRRIEAMKPVFWPAFDRVVHDAVNASLGLNSAGLATVPPEQVQARAWAHSLATVQFREEYTHEFSKLRGLDVALNDARKAYRESRSPEDLERVSTLEREINARFEHEKAAGELHRVRDVWAPTPNRIFGPPSYVQGYIEDYIDEWLLLLELSSSDAIGFPLGDGVLQFLIRPDDLRARRFDRVEVVASGY
jgi:uncharacterized protein YwqG